MMRYPHVNLMSWPFTVVPQPDECTYLADRKQVKQDLDDLLVTLGRRNASSIHVLWAWFGAGKTHILFYLRHLATNRPDDAKLNGEFITVYSEFPKTPTGFLDIYRAFALGLPPELLTNTFLEIATGSHSSLNTSLSDSAPDLYRAMYVLSTGTGAMRTSAIRWLRGETVPLADMRSIGVSRRISTSQEAVMYMGWLVRMLTHERTTGPLVRVLWMIDEFQRVQNATPKALREINEGLHSAFNACPTGLSLFLSFSGTPQTTLPRWFSPELQDRIGMTKVLVLPPLTSREALLFIEEVLEHHRPVHQDMTAGTFPFTEDCCKAIIEWLSQRSDIKPRLLMQAFGAVLEEAEPLLESGEIESIGPEFAHRVLSQRVTIKDDGAER